VIDPASPSILGAILGVSEFGLLLARRAGRGTKSADSGSLGRIWVVVVVCLALATLAALLVPQAASDLLLRARTAGAVLFLVGLVLRWYAIFYLGRFFTVNVALADDHHVVDTGPYRYVRHPSYSGSILEFVGLAIGYANWLSLLLIVLPVVAMLRWRISIEERALSGALGERYRAYMARTKRLIPGLY
jgi:protein-S-isoprenylcysteine O-methyltransferase